MATYIPLKPKLQNVGCTSAICEKRPQAIYGGICEQGTWRKSKNAKLKVHYKELDIWNPTYVNVTI